MERRVVEPLLSIVEVNAEIKQPQPASSSLVRMDVVADALLRRICQSHRELSWVQKIDGRHKPGRWTHVTSHLFPPPDFADQIFNLYNLSFDLAS